MPHDARAPVRQSLVGRTVECRCAGGEVDRWDPGPGQTPGVSVAGTGAGAGFCTAGGREGRCDAAFVAAAALATFSLALL